jgi:DNA polymerase III subunit delta
LTPPARRLTKSIVSKSPAQAAKPIYALVGADALLQLEAVQKILALLPPGVQRTDLDGETAQLSDVLDECRSFAMFGPGKLVVVRSADDFVTKYRQSLEEYAAAPSDSATLVLRMSSLPATQRLHKAIAKTGEIIACAPPKDVTRWAIDRAKNIYGATLAFDAARLLVDLIGANLSRLDSELAKLSIGAVNDKIDAEQVSISVAFGSERQMWDMTNALAAGNAAEALRRWRQLVQTDSSAEFRAVTWLGMWLENARKAIRMSKAGDSVGVIGQALRIWPREQQAPFVETAKKLGEAGVNRALDRLVLIDYQIKTGVGDAIGNIEQFLVTVGME